MSSPGSSLPPEEPNSPLSIPTEVATLAAPLKDTASDVQTGESTLASSPPGSPLASADAVDVTASSAPVSPSSPMPVGLVGAKPVPCVGTFDPDHVYQTLASLQVTVETLARRVEAIERRLALPLRRRVTGRPDVDVLNRSCSTPLRGRLNSAGSYSTRWIWLIIGVAMSTSRRASCSFSPRIGATLVRSMSPKQGALVNQQPPLAFQVFLASRPSMLPSLPVSGR